MPGAAAVIFPGYHMPVRTAPERRARDAAFAAWVAEEGTRVAQQREAFRGNLGPARAELQRLMLDRAWALLDAGEAEAADALLEFVPEAAALALLDEFFGGEP